MTPGGEFSYDGYWEYVSQFLDANVLAAYRRLKPPRPAPPAAAEPGPRR